MVEYNNVSVKLSDSQLNKLKLAVKNQTGVTLKMSMKMCGGNYLPHELLYFILLNILAPLGVTAAASAIDAGIKKKIHGSGTTTSVISIKEMNDIMKIVQALEDSNILLKGITKWNKRTKRRIFRNIIRNFRS